MNKIQTLNRRIKAFFSLFMTLCMLVGMLPVEVLAADETAETISITIDVERFTIGQGFYVEPETISLEAGATARDAIEQLLGEDNLVGDVGYLQAVIGADTETAEIPAYIVEVLGSGDTETAMAYGQNYDGDTLGEFDYSSEAGWMFLVNNETPSVGMNAYTLEDGDVMRLAFTYCGYGEDLTGLEYSTNAVLVSIADKDELLEAMAAANANPDCLEDDEISEAYDNALTVASNMVASSTATEEAAEELSELVADYIAAVEQAANQAAANAVADLITALPATDSLTLDNETAVTEARSAYDGLTADQQLLVSNVSVLEAAEVKIAELNEATESNQTAADAVAALITALPATDSITLSDETAVEEARSAYDALTEDQKAMVSTDSVTTLEAAESRISELSAAEGDSDQTVADTVTAKIAALPEAESLTLDDETTVEEARTAYDALTDTQKALVSADSVTALEAAEAAIETLKSGSEAAEDTFDPENESYVISTAADVNAFRSSISSSTTYANITVTLANDIDVAGSVWDEVDSDGEFEGVLNGKGFTISGFDDTACGLFYSIGETGLVANLNVNFSIESGSIKGGFARYVYGTINSCSISGSIENGTYLGGFAYQVSTGGSIKNCVSSADITYTGSSRCAGIARTIDGSVTNCYTIGTMTASGSKYGIGKLDEGTATSCYYLDSINVTSSLTDDGGTAKTAAKLKTQATYTDWDFDTIWQIDASVNDGYPTLRQDSEVAAKQKVELKAIITVEDKSVTNETLEELTADYDAFLAPEFTVSLVPADETIDSSIIDTYNVSLEKIDPDSYSASIFTGQEVENMVLDDTKISSLINATKMELSYDSNDLYTFEVFSDSGLLLSYEANTPSFTFNGNTTSPTDAEKAEILATTKASIESMLVESLPENVQPTDIDSWLFFTAARADYLPYAGFYDDCYQLYIDKYESAESYTADDTAKDVLAITAMGYDARDVAGKDLIDIMETNSGTSWFTDQVVSFAVNSYNYGEDGWEDEWIHELAAAAIRGEIGENGEGDPSQGIDMYIMQFQPIANYYDPDALEGDEFYDVKQAMEEVFFPYLSEMQGFTGTFYSGVEYGNPWSTAQADIMLGMSGTDIFDSMYIKNGFTLLSDLNGSTAYSADPGQCARGYEAMVRAAEGSNQIFDCTDVVNSTVPVNNAIAELPDADSITEETKAAAQEKLDAVDTLLASLTLSETQLESIDMTAYDAVKAVLNGGLEKANQEKADAVMALIEDLPSVDDLKAGDKADVVRARVAYDALTEAQQVLVSSEDLAALEAAEAKIAELLTSLPELEDETTQIKVAGLGDTVTQIIVSDDTEESDVNEAAQQAAEDAGLKDIEIVTLYDIKPDMSDEDLAIFNSDDSQYVTITLPLPEAQQGKTNYRVYHLKENGDIEWITPVISEDGKNLIFKVSSFSEFGIIIGTEMTADEQAAQTVIDLIDGLPETASITLDDQSDVEAVRTAYDALTADQQALVTNLETLTSAEAAIEELYDSGSGGGSSENSNRAAADEVIVQIDALGTISSYSQKSEVEEARSAYDALTAAQQALVTNYSTLVAAEASISALKPSTISITIDVERFTIGQGFYVEPITLSLQKGATARDAIEELLGEDNLIGEVGYLRAIDGADTQTVEIPDYIVNELGGGDTETAMAYGQKYSGDTLGEFDYSNDSGWMYLVDNATPDVGMNEYTLSNGDVMRLAFTYCGYGEDLTGLEYGTNKTLVSIADKDRLLEALAAVNSGDTSGYLADEEIAEAYEEAMEVVSNMTATQKKTNEAAEALNDAVSEYSSSSGGSSSSDDEDTPVAIDEATGIEMTGFDEGVGLVVGDLGDDVDVEAAAQQAAEEKGLTEATVIAIYDIKPDLTDEELEEFNDDSDSTATLTIPIPEDNQGMASYLIYHLKDNGDIEWITPVVSDDGTTLSFEVSSFSTFVVFGGNEDDSEPDEQADEFGDMPVITYQTHVENVGWQDAVTDGDLSGTEGEGLRLEGIKIGVSSEDEDLGLAYQTQIENIGWQDEVTDGVLSGTEGQGLRLEGIRIRLTGDDGDKYDVYYRVHAQNFGWLDWAKNGESAGTEGFGDRLEAIEIKLVEKDGSAPGETSTPFATGNIGVSYQTEIQNVGWQDVVTNGSLSGTEGQGLRLEGIKINMDTAGYDVGVTYQTQIENIGWQDTVIDGALSGTEGQGLRLEAIKISLTGTDADLCDIYYQVEVQNVGWMGWTKNGKAAGTEGFGYGLEGIHIVVVPKDQAVSGSTGTAFLSNN